MAALRNKQPPNKPPEPYLSFVCICIQSAETRWQKAVILLEFGEWLYQQNLPEDDGQLQVHLAIDLLLQKESDQTAEAGITYSDYASYP